MRKKKSIVLTIKLNHISVLILCLSIIRNDKFRLPPNMPPKFHQSEEVNEKEANNDKTESKNGQNRRQNGAKSSQSKARWHHRISSRIGNDPLQKQHRYIDNQRGGIYSHNNPKKRHILEISSIRQDQESIDAQKQLYEDIIDGETAR